MYFMNENRQKNPDVTTGSLKRHLVRLTLPTIGGMFAITIFNLTDTFFISRLGTNALAAMGFTFPIVMLVGSVSMGMASGAGSVLARAMGKQDHHLMNRIATDGILLSILVVLIVSCIGLFTMDPLFRFLGAPDETLPLVKEYMTIWYIGVIAFIMPPVGDSSMRAMGDMKRPLIVMLVCAVLNAILDPILIFGLFGFPAMGMAGASLATIISRFVGMLTTLSFIHFHYGLLDFKYRSISELIDSWKKIGPRTYRLKAAAKAWRVKYIQPGDRWYQLARGFGGAIAVNRCKDCVVEDVTVYSSPGCASSVGHSEGVIVRRLEVRFKPGENRILSTNADGVHCQGNVRGPIIEDCYFEGMADDATNMYCRPNMVRTVHSPADLTVSDDMHLEAGNRVQAFDPSVGQFRGETVIVSAEHDKEARTYRLKLKKGIPGLRAGKDPGLVLHYA